MIATYVSANPADSARAAALGLSFTLSSADGNPPFAQVWGATLSFPRFFEPINTATLAADIASVQASDAAAMAAQSTLLLNAQTIQTNLLASQATIQTWITANPAGAVLNAAQTLVLAKMLNGLCKILLQEFASTSGT